MKRIVSLVLAVSMVFGLFATVFAAGSYSDLTGENAKFASAVAALSELKVDDQPVINGYPDGTFGPEKTVTRAELAKMLVVCLGLGSEVEALATKTVFSDVPTTHWAAGWINAAAQSKVIVGYPDGSFGPEKTVTYAEAFTMALRALGYGNVADFEGTWPTAYMLKAVELGLTEDMEGIKADVAATRGNIAILLWNMLRTPMWRVTSESEHSGMTLSNENEDRMLNVKFPDYTYVEDVYVVDVDVTDKDDVEIHLKDFFEEEGKPAEKDIVAQIRNVDISKIILGEKVTALVKEGKKNEDSVFLTLIPENEIVEGIVTKVVADDNGNVEKITVNDTEYRLDSATKKVSADKLKFNDYVVFEVNGKKVNNVKFDIDEVKEGSPVITKVPYAGSEVVENVKSALRAIKEDALVIKNGEWTDREAIEEGDVYTELKDKGNTSYFMVTDERTEGVFEAYSTKKIGEETTHLMTIDGEEIRNVFGADLVVKEGEKNDTTVTLDAKGAPLNAKAKENKYIDSDVEVLYDFLGNAVALYFGDIDDLSSDGNFYAVVHGYWTEAGKRGSDMIALVGFDGEGASADEVSEGVDYKLKDNIPDDQLAGLEKKDLLEAGEARFVWAKFDSDEETIKTLVTLADGLESGDASGFTGKYRIVAVDECVVEDGKVEAVDGTEIKLPASVSVMTVTPLEDDEGDVEGFAVELSQGVKNKTEFPEGSFIAYDASKRIPRAAFVFVAEEAESQELFFGLVEDYDEASTNGVGEVTINGTVYEYDEESAATAEGDFVVYTKKSVKGKDKEVVTIKGAQSPKFIDDSTWGIIDAPEDGMMVFSGDFYGPFDLAEKSDDMDHYEDFKVVILSVSTEDDNRTLKITKVEEAGEGLAAVENKEGNRVQIVDRDGNEYIFVVTGLKHNDVVAEGVLQDEGTSNTDNTTNQQLVGSGDTDVNP